MALLEGFLTDRLSKTGLKQVAASVSQPGSQAPDILPERLGASMDAEDGSKKRKWRYFWVEDEES